MKKTVDYTQFVYEKNALVEINSLTYNNLVSAISTIAKEFRDNFPMSWKQRTMEEVQKLIIQRESIADNKVKVHSKTFLAIMEVIDKVLAKEVVLLSTIQTDWVNKETSEVVKKLPSKNKDRYQEVFSLEKTAVAQPKQYITHYGQTLLKIVDVLNGIHVKNVDLGNAIYKEELEKKNEQQPEPAS